MNWDVYCARTRGRPPRATLRDALARFGPRTGLAVDLGGGGRDAAALLARGWRVIGIGSEPAALALPRHPRLTLRREPFETAGLPGADLVNASFSLPFCRPDAFPALWRRIASALPAGGRFAGQFFGPRDDWAGDPGIADLTRAELRALVSAFEIERFDEEERGAETVGGEGLCGAVASQRLSPASSARPTPADFRSVRRVARGGPDR